MVLLWALLACHPPQPGGLSVDEVKALVRPGTEADQAWAEAVHSSLQASGKVPQVDSACQVLAVIEQESGYEENPTVPGLATMASAELETQATETLGFLSDRAVTMVLDVTPKGSTKSFRERLSTVQTERDLDEFARDVVDHHRGRVPLIGPALGWLMPGALERLNPVDTVGSMQVSVAYAQDHVVSRGMSRRDVRDAMYTVEGGVRYGTLRLFDTAAYQQPVHRFADFNAGPYASRNAAFQEQLSDLVDLTLAPDGDPLRYNGRGRVRKRQEGETFRALQSLGLMTDDELLDDLKQEKTEAFEATETWRAVKSAWAEGHGEPPPYARVPDVTLQSPKLTGTWTTATFAGRVQRRHEACLARG